jgi:hypothetical protein
MSSHLYILRDSSAELEDAEVGDDFVRGPEMLRVGAELWSLVEPERARRLEVMISAIHERDDLRIERSLLDGIATVLDGIGDVIRDLLAQLSARSLEQVLAAMPTFAKIWQPDLASLANDLEAAAVSVENLCKFLRRASNQGSAVRLSY